MSLEYIRNYYGVPAKIGARIKYGDKEGTITGFSGAHIEIELDGEGESRPYHPTWNIKYLEESKTA